jgi:hypothetical protein
MDIRLEEELNNAPAHFLHIAKDPGSLHIKNVMNKAQHPFSLALNPIKIIPKFLWKIAGSGQIP